MRTAAADAGKSASATSEGIPSSNPATWTKDSDSIGFARSPQLKVVDRALSAYVGGKNKTSLYALVDAFLDWYESKPNWLATRRRTHMIELVNYIKQEAIALVPIVGGHVFNRRMARRRLDQMLAAPEAFLRKHRISIAGDRDANAIDFRATVDSPDLLFDSGLLGTAPLSAPIVGYKFASKGSLYGPKVVGRLRRADAFGPWPGEYRGRCAR